MTHCSFRRLLLSWNTSKFSFSFSLVAYYPKFLAISHQYRKIKGIMIIEASVLPHCPFLVMFGLGPGYETSCLIEKCLDVCIGGKFQFLISLFTVFYWGLIACLNAIVISNYISKKKSCCLEITEIFSEIKSTLKYPNESLNSKPVINRQSFFLRSV